MPSIYEHLSKSAESYTIRAVQAFADEAYGDFALFSGIALEHAAKAKLANETPALLGDDWESSHKLHKAANDIALLPASVRTVGAMKALRMVVRLDPRLETELKAAEKLVLIRNGEAHMAVGEAKQDLLVAFLSAVNSLLLIDQEIFWGEHLGLVQTTLNEAAEELDLRVETALVRARTTFERRYGHLEGDQSEAMRAFIEAARNERLDYDSAMPTECPACHSPAWAVGVTDDEPVVDWDDGVPFLAGITLEFIAQELHCGACDLRLGTTEEIEKAGMAIQWENDLIDPEDWMAIHYQMDDEWEAYP